MSVTSLTIDQVTVKYQVSEVLSSISFTVPPGDYIGLVGPNGSGKTTLVRTILGLIKPSQGEITILGTRQEKFTAWQRIGYLPQKLVSFNPLFPATVREVVALGLLAGKKFPKRMYRTDEIAIDKALAMLEIRNIKNKLIGELSGGQQQRALVARAIVGEPELLLLDEPATALDPETREKFFTVLKELNEKRKVTIILITHDIGNIGKYAVKMLYLDKKVIFYGGFDNFCASPEVTDYFGEYTQHLICHRHNVEKGKS
ncbi:MAG: metal ABC transporter ATP-binding protein [Elusimicrobia bacterium]|nr:metal ABC transporter ATP-binding protein [Elusimicrobiota bacterium]